MAFADAALALEGHTAARELVASSVDEIVAAAMLSFDAWYDAQAVQGLAGQLVGVVEAGQRSTAQLTDAYLSTVATDLVGRRVAPVGLIDPSKLRKGLPHIAVYSRLAVQYRYQIATGLAFAAASSLVVKRARVLAASDLQLSQTHQTKRFTEQRQWEAYRRVIRPEASKSGVCGLCIAASDRIYTRGDLMPIHDNCCCGVMLIKGDEDDVVRDYGARMNREDLDALYDNADSKEAAGLLSTRYTVAEHGETGPTLVAWGQHFRGPAEVARATN